MKFITFHEMLIEKMITDPSNEIMDVGCGFTLGVFSGTGPEKQLVSAFMDSVTSPYLIYQPLSFDEYKKLYDRYNLSYLDSFIINQYRQYCKIFGGNHFCEYGDYRDGSKQAKKYLLVHSGNNGIFQSLYPKNNLMLAANFCTNYAEENRKAVLDYFTNRVAIKMEMVRSFSQCHNTFRYPDTYIRGYGFENKVHGNIFTCGEGNPSYILKSKGDLPAFEYFKHGTDEIEDFIRTEFKNYDRKYLPASKYSFKNLKKEATLYPILIGRPKNVH